MSTQESELVVVIVLKNDLCGLLSGRLVAESNVGVKRVLRVLLNKRDEALKGAVTIVVNEVAGTGLLELERGEARDAEGNGGREIVLGRLHLGTASITR